MKRFCLVLILVVAVSLSGCSVVRNVIRQVLPVASASTTQVPVAATIDASPTAEPEVTLVPVATPEPSPTTNPNDYISTALGIAFTVPDSWAGKYRVEEGDGFLSVYFTPSEPIDLTLGDGFLFTILKKTSEGEEYFLDSVQEVEVDGTIFVCGTSTDVSYGPEQPEYETYVEMLEEYPSVVKTLRAIN